MAQANNGIDKDLSSHILGFCNHVVGQSKVTAVALMDNYPGKSSNGKIYEVMCIAADFKPRMMSYLRTFNEKRLFVFIVDRWIFERDIERGFLGEAFAGKLIFPYLAFCGNNYLQDKEVALKKRLISELLENLVLSFPELAHHIQIKPQYFLYEVFSNRIRAFPLLAYDLTNLSSCLIQNEAKALSSYIEALNQLSAEGKITFSEQTVTISKKFIMSCQDVRIRLLNLAKNAPRTVFSSLFGVMPQLMNIVSQNIEVFLRTQKINWLQPSPICRFVDPQKYVFFPTSAGWVSLADKIDVRAFARNLLMNGRNVDIAVEPVGGMLNDVYLIRACNEEGETKVLAKRFKDWSGFKWFPLTLWSFGARSFAVTGQPRLAKECAISEYLLSEGFKVPRILHVSNAERLIFMEYIDGENLSQAIKRIATSTNEDIYRKELAKIRNTGEILAKVHSRNISLGDTKPDNVLIKEDGTIYLIDFEQASRNGDKAWDIAVFLYYSGHYLQPFESNGKAEAIAKAFIEGYLNGGGNLEDVKLAGMPKYTRVFSIFTMPAIIKAISDTCKKAALPK
ncbi:MAG: phosphotransferase [Candidatus Bathyarchaeota archaeon]|nr:phosphotransferase [Candidatus Bathyarchaeota archaeon]